MASKERRTWIEGEWRQETRRVTNERLNKGGGRKSEAREREKERE